LEDAERSKNAINTEYQKVIQTYKDAISDIGGK
jgi:hypothetical protein